MASFGNLKFNQIFLNFFSKLFLILLIHQSILTTEVHPQKRSYKWGRKLEVIRCLLFIDALNHLKKISPSILKNVVFNFCPLCPFATTQI
jgi:hypothetical protein